MRFQLTLLFFLLLCYSGNACDIAIDAGHGGQDLGTRYLQLQEKNLTLTFAKLLQKELVAIGQKNTQLIRTMDEHIDITKRTALINQVKCRFFISLHINSSLNEATSGIELYTYRTSNPETKDQLNDSDYQLIWKNLIQADQSRLSHQAALFLSQSLKKHYPQLSIKTGRQSFRILNHTSQPALLVELGYLSNDQDRERLTHSSFQAQWSKVMAQAIHDYLNSPSYSTHF